MVLVTGDGDADDGYPPPPHLLLPLRTDQRRQTVRGGRLKPLGTDQLPLRQ